MDNSVGIRLAVDDRQAKQTLVSFGDEGDAQAKRLARSYDSATDDMVAADRRRAQAAQKINALMPQTATQAAYQAGASTNYAGQSARDSAAAFKELLDRQDDLAARAVALKARLDPLTEAQRRYDAEIKNADELLAENRISEADHEKAVTSSTRALNAAKKELGEHSSALGFNRTQSMIATSAGMRFGDMLIAGQSPIRAFALESHKLGEILAFDDNGVAGGLAKVRALLTPTTIGLSAAAAVASVGAMAWLDYSNAVAKLNAAAQGSGAVLGLSGQQLQDVAEGAARAGEMTSTAAREIETGYLGIAKSGDLLSEMTAITKDFAAATGQDVKAAAAQLAAAFGDPIEGAGELADKYGMLSQAQAEHIAKLIEQGDQARAQKELVDAVAVATSGAAAKAENLASGWNHVKNAIDGAWTALGRYIDQSGFGGVALPNGLPAKGAANDAAANQARQRAATVVEAFQGDNRDGIRRNMSVLRAGIAAGGEDVGDYSKALAANQRALESWVPAQQKAAEVSAAQAKVAAARTPAAKAAAASELVLAQAHGEVITKADLMARAHDRASAASASASKAGEKHAATLAREAASMDVSAREALKVASAYSAGTAEGIEAEARRKAATDATKKGIDVEAQTRRQLNLQVAETIATTSKVIAGLRDETTARNAVLAQVEDGTLSVEGMSRAMSDEAALRPLLVLRTIAHGDALDALNKKIDEYRGKLAEAHKAEDLMSYEKGMQDSRLAVSEYEGQTADLTKSPAMQALQAAQRGAQRTVVGLSTLTDQQKLGYVGQKESEAQAKYAADRAKYMNDTVRGQQDSIELAQREGQLAGASDNYRTAELNKLRLEQDIRRRFPDMAAADVQQLVRGVAAVDATYAKAQLLQDTWSEIRSTGDQFLSDLTNPDGSGLKNLLRDVEQEFIKLTALNPLKNMLLGEKNPTLGGIFGLLSGAGKAAASLASFASSSSIAAAASITPNLAFTAEETALPRFAAGTEYFSGGQAWVGENGPELVSMPVGSKVTSAPAARRLVANDNAGGDTHIHVYAQDAVLAETVRGWVRAGVEEAKVAGAIGGASLAEANAAKRARYRIPGR